MKRTIGVVLALAATLASGTPACVDDLDDGAADGLSLDAALDGDASREDASDGSADADLPNDANDRDASSELDASDALGLDDVLDAGHDAAPDAGPITMCDALFGLPNAYTGLDDTQCRPACACEGDVWAQPVYSAEDVAQLREFVLLDPPDILESDPYAGSPPAPIEPEVVCGVVVEGSGDYRVDTFANAAAAADAGAQVSHAGVCGACSSLADLAVYIETPDLTAPVRECGLQGIREGDARTRECLLELGFTPPCAEIWYYNTLHTRRVCARDCFALIDAPYHNEDGTLNACLQCDEDLSGPVFKAFAGRTRRNTGLATAMCRPCEEVLRIEHFYGSMAR